MTYRIDIRRNAGETVLEFAGVVDEAALSELLTLVQKLQQPLSVVIAAGSHVQYQCVEPLRSLPVRVSSSSPHLRALLAMKLGQGDRQNPAGLADERFIGSYIATDTGDINNKEKK